MFELLKTKRLGSARDTPLLSTEMRGALMRLSEGWMAARSMDGELLSIVNLEGQKVAGIRKDLVAVKEIREGIDLMSSY